MPGGTGGNEENRGGQKVFLRLTCAAPAHYSVGVFSGVNSRLGLVLKPLFPLLSSVQLKWLRLRTQFSACLSGLQLFLGSISGFHFLLWFKVP